MPIKSEQQRKFMAMCLHNPEKAKDKCPPKSVAKKFIHGHSRKDESLDMNNQIDPRFALRALFEASLIAQIESGKLDEGLFNSAMTGLKRFGTRVKAGVAGFRGDAAGAQRFSNQADRMESQSQKIGRQDQQLAANKKSRALANIAAMQSKRKAATANKKTTARRDAQANYQAGAATPEQKTRFMQTASTDHYRLGLKSLFEAILVEEDFVYNTKNSDLFKKKSIAETKRGTARPAGGGTSTDTGGANLHPVVNRAAKRLAPQGDVTRFEGDPTSSKAAAAQKTHNKAMDAAFKPSEEEGAPPKNLPPATNRPGKKQAETPGGKATNPLDRPTAGKFTPRQVAARIAAMRGKS